MRLEIPGKFDTFRQRVSVRDVALSLLLVLAVVWPCWLVLAGEYTLDLNVYLAGGRAIRNGHALYGPDARVQLYGFTYPPFAALPFVLPSLLPVGATVVLMTLASLVGLGVVVELSDPGRMRRLYRHPSAAALMITVAMLACQPVRNTFTNGQINLVLAAMVMYDLLGARGGRSRGTLIGIATAIKLTPGLFIVYLLVRRRYREAANSVVAFIAVTGATWLVLPHDSQQFWTKNLYNGAGIGDISRPSNQSILGVTQRLVGASTATPIWAVLVLPVTVVGLAIAARVATAGQERFAVGIVGITSCLVSPVSWNHHWVWFVPVLAGLAAVADARGRPATLWTCGLAAFLVVITVFPQAELTRPTVVRLAVNNAYAVAAVVSLGLAATACSRRRSIPAVAAGEQSPAGGPV